MKRLSLVKRRANVIFNIYRTKMGKKRTPVVVHLYPSYKCNLRCTYCLVDHKTQVNEMGTEKLLSVIDELADNGTKMIIFLGGEFSIAEGIDRVIDRIKERGMICDAVTNAIMLPKKIDLYKKLDSICISMDGLGESNDITRGKGTSEKVLRSIELAKENGIPFRINCVITKNNINTYPELLKWAKKQNVLITFGMPFEDEIKNMLLDLYEMKDFYQNVKKLKAEGYPVLFSNEALDYMENYPLSPDKMVLRSQRDDTNIHKRYRKSCPYGRFIAYLHPDGILLPCNNLYKIRYKGPNVLDVGVKKAWDIIDDITCLSCYEAGIPEWNYLTSIRGLWKGAMITLKQILWKK